MGSHEKSCSQLHTFLANQAALSAQGQKKRTAHPGPVERILKARPSADLQLQKAPDAEAPTNNFITNAEGSDLLLAVTSWREKSLVSDKAIKQIKADVTGWAEKAKATILQKLEEFNTSAIDQAYLENVIAESLQPFIGNNRCEKL